MSELPRNSMKRLIKGGSSNMNVSNPAADLLGKILTEEGLDLAKEALRYTNNSVRQVLQGKDVKSAAARRKESRKRWKKR